MNRVCGTAIIVASLMSNLLLSGCGGKAERLEKYMSKGIEHFEAENYEKAQLEFKNVLQIEPKTADAYFYLAKIYESQKELPKAYSLYLKVVELDPDHREARAKLVRLHMYIATIRQAQGDKDAAKEEMAKAQDQVDEIIKRNPADAEAQTLAAAIVFRDGNSDAAISKIQQILQDSPGQADASSMLGLIYQKQEKFDDAIAVLEQSHQSNAQNEQILYQLAGLYEYVERFDEAEKLLVLAAQKKQSANLGRQIKLIAYYSRRDQLDKVESMINRLISEDPEDPKRHKLLVSFYASKFGPEKAEKALLKSIKEHPNLLELQFSLAEVYERSKVVGKSKDIYQTILDTQGPTADGLTAKSRLAGLYLMERDVEQASKLAEEVLLESPRDNGSLEVRGKVAMMEKKFDVAVASFRSILKDQPESSKIRTLLAEAHLRTGEVELARDNLEAVVEQDPRDVDSRMRLIRFLMVAKDYTVALRHIDKILQRDEKNVQALLSKAEALAANNDMVQSEQVLNQILTFDDKNVDAYLRLGRLHLIRKRHDDAIKTLNTALDYHPDSSIVLTELIRTYVAASKLVEAEARLKKVIKNKDSEAVANLLLGELFVAKEDRTQAKQYFQQATKLDPSMSRPYLNLAQLYQAEGEYERAIAVFDAGLNHSPEDVSLFIGLAGVYERKEDYKKAMDIYNRLLESHPSNVVGINNLAALLVDHGDGKQDLVQAKELATKLTANPQPAFMDTVAWVYYKAGEYEKAVRLLEDIVKKAPNVPVFSYHLGMAYYKMDNYVQAKTALQAAVDADKHFFGFEQAHKTLTEIAQR
jgi:tetratricopeptide (TPR) repeat protein